MCYIEAPIADVDDLIIVNELREETKAQLRFNHAIDTNFLALPSEEDANSLDDGFISTLLSRFFQTSIQTSDLTSGFSQIHIGLVEATLEEQSVVFDVIPYRISHAPPSFLNTRPILRDEPGQFDEVIPQYFADDSYDTIPSYLYQEL